MNEKLKWRISRTGEKCKLPNDIDAISQIQNGPVCGREREKASKTTIVIFTMFSLLIISIRLNRSYAPSLLLGISLLANMKAATQITQKSLADK